MDEFARQFAALTGNPPFPWQIALYGEFLQGKFPQACDLPTGLGKTSVIPIWLLALAATPSGTVPRRLVYVVNRRTVVDQSTRVAEDMRERLEKRPDLSDLKARLKQRCADPTGLPLAISTLRGQFADNREWSADPARPAVVVGTVDMIGSRLLFSGYGVGFKGRPLHAGFLGQDALLVHDEAHLEPAFQELLEAIEREQALGERNANLPWKPLQVMQLSATLRGGENTFRLTPQEQEAKEPPAKPTEPVHFVWQRLLAKKGLAFHGVKKADVAKAIAARALDHKASGRAILVFVRTIEDVTTVQTVLTDDKKGVPDSQIATLTGTLRGLERDQLATANTVFARFMPDSKLTLTEDEKTRTVYLVCTSAGEVGVDISADHMVSDLTPLESMAQRLGRVNRRGEGAALVDVVYETDPDPKKPGPLDPARWRTRTLLEELPPCEWTADRGDGSPRRIGRLIRELSDDDRRAAFSPPPVVLPAPDILFDAWALTTVRERMPGRPPVEPYLHGVRGWEPPETHVAWREEVGVLAEMFAPPDGETEKQKAARRRRLAAFAADLLDDFPLKPHELLRDRSDRVFKTLKKLTPGPATAVWLVDDDGTVEPTTLGDLLDAGQEAIERRTVLLPPAAGGLRRGTFDGTPPAPDTRYDIADPREPGDTESVRHRAREWSDDSQPGGLAAAEGMRLVRTIDTRPNADEEAPSADDAERPPHLRYWHWYELPRDGDGDGSKYASRRVTLATHTKDVSDNTELILAKLGLPPELRRAVELAAAWHDLGKDRTRFQQVLGNWKGKPLLAKSGGRSRPGLREDYRHEFGSLLDVQHATGDGFAEYRALPEEWQDVVLHLIASHHGRARPHFPAAEAFDPESKGRSAADAAAEVPRRYGRLQRRYGRWGLAYLESLLRAADYEASANPSPEKEDPS